uniref:DUF1768 domain-containing protein n=1 Tax=Meloidogyne hapla TaxID=6305 RepID=A0A1I8B6R6_MELHA
MHKISKKPPFRVGDMLGMMSREYEDWSIMSFYTGGCKQYAMKMKHRESGEIKYIVKCRGCWEQVDTPLDYNQFMSMVERYGEKQDPVILERTHFQPSWRHGQVTNTAACILERLNLRHETKSYPPEEILGDQPTKYFRFQLLSVLAFDNRFRVHFTLLGRTFSSIEQYFIWQKARFFGDLEIATEVMIIDNPLTIRRIGKRIRGYNQEEWNSVRNKLRATGDGLITQASASELHWSNGVSPKSARLKDPSQWEGE